MYWCKLKPLIVIALAAGLLVSGIACTPDVKENGGMSHYFDIKGYFTTDIARLNKHKKLVLKTVTHNGVTETKKVGITNWAQELDTFIGADINRPAWRNSYSIATGDGLVLYKAKDKDLKVREIIIKKDKNSVRWIVIYTKTENMLYKKF